MPEIKQLNDNLKTQARLYDELKQLAEFKQQALVKNNLQEIEAVTVREEQLLLEGARLEKERLLWAEQIAHVMGKPAEKITLTELAVRYPELQEVKVDLEKVLTGLKDVHEVNTQLLKQAVRVLDFTIGMFTHEDKTTYSKPGRKNKETPKSRSLIDKNI